MGLYSPPRRQRYGECIAAINNGEMSSQAYNIVVSIPTDHCCTKCHGLLVCNPKFSAESTDFKRINDPELFPSKEVLERSYLYKQLEPNSIQIRNRIVDSLR